MVEDRYIGFRDFVAARSVALSRTAFLLTGDRHRAEELLQESLVRVVGRWAAVIAGGDPEPYVRRVMYTVHVSQWRKHRGRERDLVGDVGSVPDLATASTDRVTMVAALRALTPKQRTVLVLRYYEDLTERQTAEILGVSVSTVKGQAADALGALRKQSGLALAAPPERVTT